MKRCWYTIIVAFTHVLAIPFPMEHNYKQFDNAPGTNEKSNYERKLSPVSTMVSLYNYKSVNPSIENLQLEDEQLSEVTDLS
jgi:hypothetical protein